MSWRAGRAARPRSAAAGANPRCGPRLTAILVLAALFALLGRPAAILAHSTLHASSPAAGESLSLAPRELRLTFTEPVEPAIARVELVGPTGPIALAPLLLHPDSASVLVALIRGPLVAGAYTVRWQVTGADGHPVRGEYSFAIASDAGGLVQNPPGPTAPGQPAPPLEHHTAAPLTVGSDFGAESPLYAAVRWLTFLGLVGVIGVVAFRWVVLRRLARGSGALGQALVGSASGRAAGLGLWAAGLVALAAVLRLYAQSYALHGAGRALDPALLGTMLVWTVWGWGWLLQAGAVTLALAGFAMARAAAATDLSPSGPTRVLVLSGACDSGAGALGETAENRPLSEGVAPKQPGDSRSSGWILAALGALVLAFTPALSGHAAATPRLAVVAVLVDGLHVLGAGGWLGSLLLVVSVGIPAALRHGGSRGGAAVASLVNAFSPTALLCAAIVVATGAVSAWLHLGSVAALWESTYGRTLLLKLAILSVVFGTGAYNWRKVRPALGEGDAARRLGGSASLELATGVIVLAVTAVLVATPPPLDESSLPAADATHVEDATAG